MIPTKVRKRAKIINRYNQAPHLTQDTNGKRTTSPIDITNESQEISPFPASDHKETTKDLHESITMQDRNNINAPQKKHPLGTVSKSKSLRFHYINFKSVRNKGKKITTLVETVCPDVILGTETWLSPDISSSEIFDECLGYDVHSNDRPDKRK